MKALKIIGVIVLAVVVILVIYILAQPDKAHIEESITINKPVAMVFEEINTFKNFNAWSPWAKMDPEATYTFEGPESGVGAKMSWDGKQVGKGSQWIEESIPNERVKNGLSFEGYDDVAYAELVLTPESENATKVTWTYDGDNNGFMAKAMWSFLGGMLTDQYKQGLLDLKTIVESKPDPEPEPPYEEHVADSVVVE